jgi:hypothetical protein
VADWGWAEAGWGEAKEDLVLAAEMVGLAATAGEH